MNMMVLRYGDQMIIIDAGLGFATQQPSTSHLSNAHSVAVDAVFNRAYVPISSAATGHLCSSMGGVDAQGCIAVFSPASAPTALYAAVAPNARTTTVNRPVTAFATTIDTLARRIEDALGATDNSQARPAALTG